ncbi:MAG: radical SAM protein [Parachlamydiales bacterium]
MKAIEDKVRAGERLSYEEGLSLFQCEPKAVAELADWVRKERVGDTVTFASTLYLHPTNLCELSCPMCSFYAKPGWKTAWFLSPEECERRIRKAYPLGLTEVHVVGGLWRDCDLSYYEDLFARIKRIDPQLHIKALTPVEYDFLAKLHGISIEQVFERMIGFGLDSVPGGGAEILVEEVRKKIAGQKITTEEYLTITETAHRMGLRSNITMLYGHIEGEGDIITHLIRVRELQDRTGGFRAFVPLKWHSENNALGKRKNRLLPPKDNTLVYGISRLMLDNIPSLKLLWKYLGVEEAQRLLGCGGNDLSSTYVDEQIIEMAGSIRMEMTRERMCQLIEAVGRVPKEVHSGYEYLVYNFLAGDAVGEGGKIA